MEKEALLYEKLDNQRVRCYLCAHACLIVPGGTGVCGVRENRSGELVTLAYAQAIAAHVDPIEKKPLYHFLPGSSSYSIATIGCNFHCGFCQNWEISQVRSPEGRSLGPALLPREVVAQAQAHDCASVSYTYTEPTIFFEYAYDTARCAHEAGLRNVFVTNGYMSNQALEMISPYLDAANVDLKSFREDFYATICKAHLAPVLETITRMKALGIWVEVTTLVIPGQNDSPQELKEIAQFIASVGKDIPWHVSRFHPDYRFLERIPTPLETLQSAAKIASAAGLEYVYLGNVHSGSDTRCPRCRKVLIRRLYFDVIDNAVKDNKCPYCQVPLAGVFFKAA